MEMRTMVIASLALLALSVGFGLWIGIAGAPYNTALLTVHKLSSVAFAVLSVIYFIGTARKTGIAAWDTVLAVVFAASLVALLATGAIMSGKAETAPLLRILHAVSSGILSLSAAWKLLAFLIG